jgi:hypothetical protein
VSNLEISGNAILCHVVLLFRMRRNVCDLRAVSAAV